MNAFDAFVDKAGDNKFYLWLLIMGGTAIFMPLIMLANKLFGAAMRAMLPDMDKEEAELAAMERDAVRKKMEENIPKQ